MNSEEDEDIVVATDPDPGERLSQGSTVDVEVSNGSGPETILPDLLGRTREAARITLTALREETDIQFRWTFTTVDTTDEDLRGQIASTDPEPGAAITKDIVVITIYLYRFLGRALRGVKPLFRALALSLLARSCCYLVLTMHDLLSARDTPSKCPSSHVDGCRASPGCRGDHHPGDRPPPSLDPSPACSTPGGPATLPTTRMVRRFWVALVGPGAVADLLRLTAAAHHGTGPSGVRSTCRCCSGKA